MELYPFLTSCEKTVKCPLTADILFMAPPHPGVLSVITVLDKATKGSLMCTCVILWGSVKKNNFIKSALESVVLQLQNNNNKIKK